MARRRQVLAWIGGVAMLATAVVALRQTQPPAVNPDPDLATTSQQRPNHVVRFAVDGVLLPEPPPQPPAAPVEVAALPNGQGRLRVAWGSALAGGADPANAVGYEVRWRPLGSGREQQRMVATPEIQLDGLPEGGRYAVEVRSVDAFGQRSAPTRADGRAGDTPAMPGGAPWSGLFESFTGAFSVDTAAAGNRWHFSGYPGCTSTSAGRGMHAGELAVDLDCGADLAVLRYRSPLQLAPAGTAGTSGSAGSPELPGAPGERGRVGVVTDAAGPRARLTIDLVPGPADQVGASVDAQAAGMPAATAAALPDGAVRVVVDDTGAHVLAGPGVPRTPDPPTSVRAPARGAGVMHRFEVVLVADAVHVLQDGTLVAAAGLAPSWQQAYLLIGLTGPPGRKSRMHLDAVGMSGAMLAPPLSYVHPVVPATRRLLGPAEDAPGIGISGEPVRKAAAARLVATTTVVPGVDLNQVTVQYGQAVVPARPVLPGVPSRAGSTVTVVAELPAGLLGPAAPPSVSPMVFRAPGAQLAIVPIVSSYLELTPLPGALLALPQPGAGGERPPAPDTSPPPTLRLLDSAEQQVTTTAPGTRLLVEVTLDGVGGQLGSGTVAGVAGLELWLDNRRFAALPTAIDGPGVGGRYSIALSTRPLLIGPHFIELRVIPANPAGNAVSALANFTVT